MTNPDPLRIRADVGDSVLPASRWMVSGHRRHLACEFSNWVEAAFA